MAITREGEGLHSYPYLFFLFVPGFCRKYAILPLPQVALIPPHLEVRFTAYEREVSHSLQSCTRFLGFLTDSQKYLSKIALFVSNMYHLTKLVTF